MSLWDPIRPGGAGGTPSEKRNLWDPITLPEKKKPEKKPSVWERLQAWGQAQIAKPLAGRPEPTGKEWEQVQAWARAQVAKPLAGREKLPIGEETEWTKQLARAGAETPFYALAIKGAEATGLVPPIKGITTKAPVTTGEKIAAGAGRLMGNVVSYGVARGVTAPVVGALAPGLAAKAGALAPLVPSALQTGATYGTMAGMGGVAAGKPAGQIAKESLIAGGIGALGGAVSGVAGGVVKGALGRIGAPPVVGRIVGAGAQTGALLGTYETAESLIKGDPLEVVFRKGLQGAAVGFLLGGTSQIGAEAARAITDAVQGGRNVGFYREVLGVGPNATKIQINKAFRELAKQYHPDVNPADPTLPARYVAISEAKQVLDNVPKLSSWLSRILPPAERVSPIGPRIMGVPGLPAVAGQEGPVGAPPQTVRQVVSGAQAITPRATEAAAARTEAGVTPTPSAGQIAAPGAAGGQLTETFEIGQKVYDRSGKEYTVAGLPSVNFPYIYRVRDAKGEEAHIGNAQGQLSATRPTTKPPTVTQIWEGQVATPGAPTPAMLRPDEAELLSTLRKSVPEALSLREDLIRQEIDYLKATMGKGTEPGGIVRDVTGDIITAYGRRSLNDRWYQKWYAQHKRKPNAKELREIAIGRLEQGGTTDGEIAPPNEDFLESERVLSTVEALSQKAQAPAGRFPGAGRVAVVEPTPEAAAPKPAVPLREITPIPKLPVVAIGQTVYRSDTGEALTVTNISDRALLGVKNARGTEFKMGRGAVTTQAPPLTAAKKEVSVEPVTPKAVSVADKNIAAHLRKTADSMQRQIDEKRNPAIGDLPPTARRARMTQSSWAQADRLTQLQTVIRTLADRREAGTLPEILRALRSRAQVEYIMLSPSYPGRAVRVSYLDDLIKDTKGRDDVARARESLARIAARREPDKWVVSVTEAEMDQIEQILKAAPNQWLSDEIADYKRIAASGIRNEAEYKQARDLLLSMTKVETAEAGKQREIKKAEMELIGRKMPGYFPTPKPVVEKMLAEADIQPGMKVLEPSAGKGNIADAIREAVPKADLSVNEINGTLRQILDAKGYTSTDEDFLQMTGEYDRIVMNPPFEQMQDIDHVRHAYDLLKPGGRLVSIMSPGPFFRSDKKAAEFREWFEGLGGTEESLPEGSFKSSERPTGVATKMVVLEKPAEVAAEMVGVEAEAPPAAEAVRLPTEPRPTPAVAEKPPPTERVTKPAPAAETPKADLADLEKQMATEVAKAEGRATDLGFVPKQLREKGPPKTEEFRFEDDEIEARYQAAKGLTPVTFGDRLADAAIDLKQKATRTYASLPETAQFFPAKQKLLWLKKQAGVASQEVTTAMQAYSLGIQRPDLGDLFGRAVLVNDLRYDYEKELDLPQGFTRENYPREKSRVDAAVTKTPDVGEAVQKRRNWREALDRAYIKSMQDIGLDVEDRFLDKDGNIKVDYMRHQVLRYANARGIARGIGKKLRTPTGRGWLKKREGWGGDINTNYLEADWEVAVQQKIDMAKAETIKFVEKDYSIHKEVKDDYRKALEALLVKLDGEGAVERLKFGMRENDIPPIAYENTLRSKLEKLEPGVLVKKGLDDWHKFIPDTHVAWQPREGNLFYFAESIPAKLVAEIMKKATGEVGISAEDMDKVLAMGGKRKELVLPAELAKTLDNLIKPRPNDPISVISRGLVQTWKQSQLVSLWRLVAYNFRNFFSDFDAMMRGIPGAIKRIPQAWRELFDVYFKRIPITGRLQGFFKRGGFEATQVVQEIGDITKLEPFRNLVARKTTAKEIPAAIIKGYLRGAWNVTKFRECVLRYAVYLEASDQMRKSPDGRPKTWGASIPEQIMSLKDIDDRAFVMSNELIGAYDEVSEAVQYLSTYAAPFARYQEVEFKREIRLFKNAIRDPKASEKAARTLLGAVGRAPRLMWGAGTFLLKASALWSILMAVNLLAFPDEERDLPPDVRGRCHIILGRNPDGSVRYFSRLGAIGDFLEWFGLDTPQQLVSRWLSGKISAKEVVQEIAYKGAVRKAWNMLAPWWKALAEIPGKIKTYPDVFEPGKMRNVGLYLAEQLGLGDEYRIIAGLPHRPYAERLRAMIVASSDPEEAAYYEILDEKDLFLKTKGKYTGYGGGTNPRSNALYNLKMAIRYEDLDAMEKYMQQYVNLGGTDEGMETSLRDVEPLFGLSGKLEREFKNDWLDDEGRRRLEQAEAFYKTVILGGEPLRHWGREVSRVKPEKQ